MVLVTSNETNTGLASDIRAMGPLLHIVHDAHGPVRLPAYIALRHRAGRSV